MTHRCLLRLRRCRNLLPCFRLRSLLLAACSAFNFDLMALTLTLLTTDLNHFVPSLINQWTVNVILRGYIHTRVTTKTTFKLIYTPHILTRLQNRWDDAKVEVVTVMLLRPLE